MRILIVLAAGLLAAAPAVAQPDWCLDADDVSVAVDGATVTVFHDAALYNCCPDPFQYSADFAGDQLTVVETEVLTNPCSCMCCFDLQFAVEDVPAGEWTVVFRWFDTESGDWVQVERPVTVPDVGQGGSAQPGLSLTSECLTSPPTGVEDPAPGWGGIKSLYR